MDLSILISTRNRAAQLQHTLDRFEQLEADGLRWEIVLVDNGSRDATPQLIDRACRRLPLVALHEPRPGKNIALNRALNSASGKLLVFTDDDVLVGRRWLKEYAGGEQRYPDDVVFCGPVDPLWPTDAPDWIKDPAFAFAGTAYGRFRPAASEGPIERRPLGGNLAIRASVFRRARFDETIGPRGSAYVTGSESELLRRLGAQGERFIYLPNAGVQHVIRPEQLTLKWLFGRSYKYGRSHARFQRREKVVHLFGAPRYQWRRLLAAWFKSRLTCWSAPRGRFEAGNAYHQLKGYLYEYRQLGKQHEQVAPDHFLPPNSSF